MPPFSNQSVSLNEKQIWDMWFEEGTLERVSQRLFEMGIVNPKTNKPVSRWGLEIAAWRYACNNIDAAKADFRKDAESRNIPWDEQSEFNFYRRLVIGSKSVYTGKSLDKFIASNNLEQFRKFL